MTQLSATIVGSNLSLMRRPTVKGVGGPLTTGSCVRSANSGSNRWAGTSITSAFFSTMMQ